MHFLMQIVLIAIQISTARDVQQLSSSMTATPAKIVILLFPTANFVTATTVRSE
jgi:hypothetical protein